MERKKERYKDMKRLKDNDWKERKNDEKKWKDWKIMIGKRERKMWGHKKTERWWLARKKEGYEDRKRLKDNDWKERKKDVRTGKDWKIMIGKKERKMRRHEKTER